MVDRGNPEKLDESDGHSWADFVPPEEPFTGISHASNCCSYHCCWYQLGKLNEKFASFFCCRSTGLEKANSQSPALTRSKKVNSMQQVEPLTDDPNL